MFCDVTIMIFIRYNFNYFTVLFESGYLIININFGYGSI